MKLKEKWFKQFYASKKGTPLYGISWEDAARMIYFAGFEKAREMSAEAMKPFSYETGYRFGLFSTNETKTVISSFSLDKIIMNIGEEEVEDELT